MNTLYVARKYFEAWNSRDPSAIVATYAEGGTYTDPASGGALTGQALAEYTGGLFSAFPDLSFDVVSVGPANGGSANDGMVAAQWLMKGTNTGSFGGGPPTGQSVALPGADFFTIEGDKIRSVQGYFDQKTFVEQLGLQTIVQPYSIGPVSFGNSVYLQLGKLNRPGAFSITSISVRSEEEAQEVGGYSQRILQELAQMPGFISALLARIGHRMLTATAWENADAPNQILQGGAHKEAMDRMFSTDFCAGFMTSVWVPDRINALWVRCTICGQMSDYDQGQGKCRCGQPLPEPPPYW